MSTKTRWISGKECQKVYDKAHNGDEKAVKVLFDSTIYLIKNIAIKKSPGSKFSIEELTNIGVLGFYRAIKTGKYDYKKGAWSTWVHFYIWDAMHREILSARWSVRVPWAKTFGKDSVILKETHSPTILSSIEDRDSKFTIEDEDDLKLALEKLGRLEERERFIVLKRTHNVLFKHIAEDLDISKQRVEQIYKAALQKLKVMCNAC
jgi:RNA polymerase sigma factor (sigma-70 family)